MLYGWACDGGGRGGTRGAMPANGRVRAGHGGGGLEGARPRPGGGAQGLAADGELDLPGASSSPATLVGGGSSFRPACGRAGAPAAAEVGAGDERWRRRT